MNKVFLAICSLFLTSCSLLNISPKTNSNGLLSIKLVNDKVQLLLSDKQSFDNPTKALNIKETYVFEEFTYSALPSSDILDNEETPFDYGLYKRGNDESVMRYFKYTFYFKSTCEYNMDYIVDISLEESKKSANDSDRTIADTLRVMVFENKVDDNNHNKEIYAKESTETNYDKQGNRTNREFVSVHPNNNQEDEEHPLAKSFINDTTIAKYHGMGFSKDEIMRFTIVVWLEGEDPQSTALAAAPTGSSVQLSISLDAYTND